MILFYSGSSYSKLYPEHQQDKVGYGLCVMRYDDVLGN